MSDDPKVTVNGKDLNEELKKTFMCMFHDLRTNCHGLNITTPTEVFGFLLDKDDLNKQAGGILTYEKALALRDFLNDFLKENKTKKLSHFKWEEIHSYEDRLENVFQSTYRAKVFGGWLIRQEMLVDADRELQFDGWTNCQNSICFMPDPTHEWSLEEGVFD